MQKLQKHYSSKVFWRSVCTQLGFFQSKNKQQNSKIRCGTFLHSVESTVWQVLAKSRRKTSSKPPSMAGCYAKFRWRTASLTIVETKAGLNCRLKNARPLGCSLLEIQGKSAFKSQILFTSRHESMKVTAHAKQCSEFSDVLACCEFLYASMHSYCEIDMGISQNSVLILVFSCTRLDSILSIHVWCGTIKYSSSLQYWFRRTACMKIWGMLQKWAKHTCNLSHSLAVRISTVCVTQEYLESW